MRTTKADNKIDIQGTWEVVMLKALLEYSSVVLRQYAASFQECDKISHFGWKETQQLKLSTIKISKCY